MTTEKLENTTTEFVEKNDGNCALLIEIEVENNYQKTIPSCNNSAATIVTTRIPRTTKGTGTTCPAFREGIRLLFARVPEAGGVSVEKCNPLFL